MKQFALFSLAIVWIVTFFSCNTQGNQKESSQKMPSSEVQVYYFHFTHRCNTCISVEATAKQAVEILYTAKVKSGEYSFQAINLDDTDSKILAEKLGIGGQTLMVVSGNRKVDITEKGFMNAHDLEKMKTAIKMAIEQVKKG